MVMSGRAQVDMMFDFSRLLAPAGGRPAARPARQAPGGPPRAAPPAWRRRAAALPAALLGALCLLATAPAGAQTRPTVWSATLTTQEYHTGLGCYRPDCEAALTSNQFTNDGNAEPEVALFPAASALQGFVRVVNASDRAGTVRVRAFDDAGEEYDPLTLAIGAGEVVHFNSNDLESGNTAKGLTGGTGPGEGNWRLAFETGLDVQVLGYVRTPGGFVTSMHDTVAGSGGVYEVAFFNPGSNTSQVSVLRLANRSAFTATVTIRGLDDAGEAGEGEVRLTIPAGAARMLRAPALESGGEGFDGALGDGRGKWRLRVASDQPLASDELMHREPHRALDEPVHHDGTGPALSAPALGAGRRPGPTSCPTPPPTLDPRHPRTTRDLGYIAQHRPLRITVPNATGTASTSATNSLWSARRAPPRTGLGWRRSRGFAGRRQFARGDRADSAQEGCSPNICASTQPSTPGAALNQSPRSVQCSAAKSRHFCRHWKRGGHTGVQGRRRL